jgi:antagonist of KipI
MSGAEFVVTIDEVAVPLNRPIPVSPGARLRFGTRRCGARAYVAIGGGIATPVVFGSRATHLASRMGGVDGRPIARGDRVPLGPARQTTKAVERVGELEDRVRPFSLKRIGRHENRLVARVRVLPGPQTALFAREAWGTLHSAVYSIASESDRMGYRLHGPALRYARPIDMISEATPLGSVQVPPSGQPILLMADRQTTGGYPKIATVITADSGVAGQLGPGDTIQFEEVNQAEALAALLVEERALMAIEALVAS